MCNNTAIRHDKAMKYDGEKVRLDLLPVAPLLGVGKVLTFGAQKYGARNWEKGLDWSRCYAAALRHLFAWWSGETPDDETGLNHLDHAICELMFLREFAGTHPELDDRPKPESTETAEVETLLDVVRKTVHDIHWCGKGCPGDAEFSDAFSLAGYKQPRIECPRDALGNGVDCYTCWNRPAEKLEAIKPESTPSPAPLARSWIDCVKEFNRAYSAEAPTKNHDLIRTQLSLIRGEITELIQAFKYWEDVPSISPRDCDARKEILDAICDSIYVLIGLALKMGFDLDGAFREVHRSNMSKLGEDGKPIRREDGKILKGPNFTPPDLTPYI